MKKIHVTGTDLFMALTLSPTSEFRFTESPFPIELEFLEAGKIKKGKFVLHDRDRLFTGETRTILSFTGMLTMEEKEPLFCSGMFDRDDTYEDCYLLVVEPQIIEINITKQEFISLVKEYCASRNIPVDEDGNGAKKGFELFESIPAAGAPSGILVDRDREDMTIYTTMHNDYFPMVMTRREPDGVDRVACFGKFITENKIKVFTKEEVYLHGTRNLFAPIEN